jgi:DNA primase
MPNIAAVGAARVQPDTVTRLARHGVDTVVLAFDNDQPGRDGLARAIERISLALEGPTLRVVDPAKLGGSKDPDDFVREQGIDAFRGLVDRADCAIRWRALNHASDVTPASDLHKRRTALARAGEWLGSLPPRLALEQEDAVRAVSDRCGYTPEAVGRSFRARFWSEHPDRPAHGLGTRTTPELDRSVDM